MWRLRYATMALIPTPKQFVPLIQGKSLLRLTAERLKPLLQAFVTNPITLVTAAEHRFLACDAMNQASVESKLLLEPAGRNTAPAILAAAIPPVPTPSRDLLKSQRLTEHRPRWSKGVTSGMLASSLSVLALRLIQRRCTAQACLSSSTRPLMNRLRTYKPTH
jgi:hypothetical protein